MTRRAARGLVVCVSLCAALAGSLPPALAVAYGGIQAAGPATSWNPGKALAASDEALLSAWASDCPPPKGKCARDSTPKMGVYIQRSPAGARPAAWKKPIRVSPGSRQAERASVGADGSLAAVGWVTQTSYLHYEPAARRVFWMRVSTDGGVSWRGALQMTVADGRVDYPRIAVSESVIYATWTNAATGEVRLGISDDAGATWTKRTLATSSAHADGNPEGFAALPDVGASGQNVVVVWQGDDGGAVEMIGSNDGGSSWGSVTELSSASEEPGLDYAAAQGASDGVSHRVAIAYGTDGGIGVRTFDGGGLSGPRDDPFDWPAPISGVTFVGGYGPAIAPFGTDGLVVAAAACRNTCDTSNANARIDVVTTESGDDGQSWSTPIRLTDASQAPYRINDEPSIALTSGARRIAFDRYQTSFTNYRVGMRSGS
ncbi:MAG TPA: sialidase family protein [Actinomycetota bacterium]|nr:sialidase family protein [Actinomycetota bacterium]